MVQWAYAYAELTSEGTCARPRPSRGSRRGRQPEMSPQTGRRSGPCSCWARTKCDVSGDVPDIKNKKKQKQTPLPQKTHPSSLVSQSTIFFFLNTLHQNISYFMPCWKREFLLVLQMMRSAHWTMTMLAKKLVWQVYSTIFLCS